MKNYAKYYLVFLALGLSSVSFATAPKVGRAAAARYFQNESKAGRHTASNSNMVEAEEPESTSRRRVDHYMSLGFGTFSEGTAYNWGQNGREAEVGKWAVDLAYRLDEQEYLFDQSVRISYAQFKPANQDAKKLSFMYAATFPEAGSKFPLYFGVAAGLGIFTQQLSDESQLTVDYQLFLGLRTFNVFSSVGFYVEGGMRNHLQLTSDGQFNGTFLSLGSVFTF